MKNSLLILSFVVGLQFFVKSQVVNSYDRLIETREKTLIGNSKQFRSLDLSISFQKTIQSNDTVYYIKFNLTTSPIEDNCNIYIGKNNKMTFSSKTGKTVVLKLHKDIKTDALSTEESFTIPQHYYTAKFYIKVTKEDLLALGSEKFYTLTLEYNDAKAKEINIATFYTPKFLTSRSFIKKDIQKLIHTPILDFRYSE